MTQSTVYLSPNGAGETRADGPATRLLAGTLEGVQTFGRDGPGKPWELIDASLTDRHVGALLYEPMSGKLFAGCHADGGLWVSDDGEGKAWRRIAEDIARQHVYALAARRIGDKVTLFLGTSPPGLYVSDDLGETWRECASMLDVPDTDKWTFPPPPHIPHVKNITFHPADAKTVYVSVEQGALLKTTDDGETWIELAAYSTPGEIAYRDLHRLLIHPDDANLFYLATGEGLYRSDDGGESFAHLMRRGDRLGYPDFLFWDPRDMRSVFVGGSYRNPGYWYEAGKAESCVLHVTDGGETWTELKNGLPDPIVGAFEAMSLHYDGETVLLAVGTATGEIYVSENAGESWELMAEGIAPVSKDDHHLPFLTPEERAKHAAERGIAT